VARRRAERETFRYHGEADEDHEDDYENEKVEPHSGARGKDGGAWPNGSAPIYAGPVRVLGERSYEVQAGRERLGGELDAAKKWVVYCKPPFAGLESVLAYLSNSSHCVAIAERRLECFNSAGKKAAGRQPLGDPPFLSELTPKAR